MNITLRRKPSWYLPPTLAMLLWGAVGHAATVNWDTLFGMPGDGVLWTNPLNWNGDALPASTDNVVFGTGPVATVLLPSNQTVNNITFNSNFTLGAFGSSSVLNNTTGNITVSPGVFGTINAAYNSPVGLNLAGGGSLYLNNVNALFAGNIVVDGAGTTLVYRSDNPIPSYNGMGSAQEFGRGDMPSLGVSTAVKTITLTNGGEFKYLGGGNNPEGGYKNIVIGAGGGGVNLAAGFTNWSLDDAGQLGAAAGNTFTKSGNGRLILTSTLAANNPLAGPVVINGGMLSLDNQVSQVVGANTYNRFVGIAATGTSVTVNNGGVLLLNNSGQAFFDLPTLNANNGSILAIQGNDQIFGYSVAGGASTVTNLNIDGTVSLLTRELFNPQGQRFPRLRAVLNGTGTLDLIPNTNAGGTPRVVIERGVGSTFSGVFRLSENSSLEAHPRNNAVIDVGKVIADGDIQFAGWGSTLDLRDSNPAAASLLGYTTNDISVTTNQAGAVNIISVTRTTNTATGTGHMFDFGSLNLKDHRLAISGNNSYQVGFTQTASIGGKATIEMRSDNTPLVFSNSAAISEDAAGRSLTFLKTGVGNAAARDVISGGAISVSNLEVATGTLQLRGANGAITTGFGGAAPVITVNGGANNFTNGLPSQGLLNLDSNTGHVVGATTVFAAANNNDRIVDSATLNMRSNSTLRLTSASGLQTTETIGTTNVTGHATFDISKQGTAPAPVALTLTTLNLSGGGTANFTGSSLGVAGTNTSRIIIPGTATGLMGSQYHSGNEWAQYDSTLSNGFELGVTPLTSYTTGSAETLWAAGQQIKQNGATLPTLTGNRTADRFNFQTSAVNQPLNLAGFVLNSAQGGIISSVNTIGFTDGATGAVPSGTAGLTAGTAGTPSQLYVHANAQIDIRTPIIDNGVGGSVDFVKSGTGTVRLIHQGLGVGVGTNAINPFSGTTWTSTLTGSWIVNDGRLEVHRGQYLGGRPVVMNGGHLEINEPVSNANADGIIPGWGNNIIINGNATIAADDNGESADGNTGDRALVKLGSLTINNNSILGISAFSDQDIAFMGGATFNGKATINTGIGRGTGNQSNIISGVLAGSGFDMIGTNGSAAVGLGGGAADTLANTYDGAVTIYAGTLRLNKANGVTAITDGLAAEDVVINGGVLAWGPGQHGDLLTTNNINTLNNGLTGIFPNSPAAIKTAGQNQIADTATVTLLTGTLGEADRINNETFGTLIQKNGTFNVGLGSISVTSATISGGAFNIERGGSFSAGTLNLLPGAPDLNITTGIPDAVSQTKLNIGAGGINLNGQNINLGTGSNGNVTGSGAVLTLGGDLSYTGTQLIGGSFARKGIFIQTGNSFREIGASRVDLAGGNRTLSVDTDSIFTITAPLANGGIIKAGGGGLALENYQPSSFAGPVTVNNGVLFARADGAFGTSAGGVAVNSGGTVKLESGWSYGDNFTVTGPGSILPGEPNLRELGALIAEAGTSHLTGSVVLGGAATLAGNTLFEPSANPSAGGMGYRIGTLSIESAGGITGAGNLTLSGNGDGVILNGINTTSGNVIKDGAGRWTVGGSSLYTGTTSVTAGVLRVTSSNALGTAGAGTTVFGGSLELAGGVSLAEPLTLYGIGSDSQSGALESTSGSNSLSGPIQLGSASTIRVDNGSLSLSPAASITGTGSALTLAGNGSGTISGALSLGTVSGTDALIKNGTGTWTLGGTSSFTGTTRLGGGSLVISAPGAVLNSASALNVSGGSLSITGAAQTVNGLNLQSGGGSINGGAGLTVGAINRTAGATANFTGTVNTSAVNTNGILGAYATYGSNDFATVTGGALAAATYQPLPTTGVTGASDNASALTIGRNISGAISANTLKTSGSGISSASSITLGAGGLLHQSNLSSAGLTASVISGATSGSELVVNVANGNLGTASPLIGAGSGSLTKSGNGNLSLFGTSSFTGSVNVNAGTLTIPGGVVTPGVLGGSLVNANRAININGGALAILSDWDLNDYDLVTAGTQSMQFAIGSGGGTLQALYGSNLIINDAGQLSGPGDLTFSGGGRYSLNGTGTVFNNFTGNLTVDGGILTASNSGSVGGRQEQTITLKPGSALINQASFGLGLNGLPNNLVLQGNAELYALGTPKVFGGDVQLSGTNMIALMERDNLTAATQVYLNGRVSGTGVTLNVFGSANGNPLYLTSGANPITGTMNLNANAVIEARSPGSLGVNTGDVTVNLQGANSRLLLRNWENGDYRVNVNVTDNSEINSDRLVNYGAGANQLLSINNLSTSGADKILTFASGNGYTTRVGGTASLNANTILNATGNVLFENGISFGGGATILDKRGGSSVILRGASNNTGATIVQGGFLILEGANGSLPNTSSIQLRGGELRVDNGDALNSNRLNDAAAISLGGGVLRITGQETLGTVTATSGTTQIISNPISDTVPTPLTLTGFTRQLGAVVQFQAPDVGIGAVGAGSFGQTRISSRIIIPGQANTTQTIPGIFGNNNIDFVQYDGTTVDSGAVLGVREMRNPGTGAAFPTNYSDNTAETGWNDTIIFRHTNATDNTAVTTTLTANRVLEAIKVESGGTNRDYTIAMGANNLRIESGGILDVGNGTHDLNINGTTGILTAGPATPGAGTVELFLGGSAGGSGANINAIIGDNGSQPLAFVKTGANFAVLNPPAANTYSGGTYINSGTLRVATNNALGTNNTINLSGGVLDLYASGAAADANIGGFGQNIVVNANSVIQSDNGAATAILDTNYAFGGVTINGPYTLGLRAFDSVDTTFTGTHVFAGTPTLDMAQQGSGSNPNTAATASIFTLAGAITGSGFYISSSGASDNTAGILQIGNGEAVANTYTGKVTVVAGSFSDDLFIQLNKAAGTAAITGDLQLDGGIVLNMADNQIADTSNVVLNRGALNFNGKNETIASVLMNGGGVLTNNGTAGSTPAANVINITGNLESYAYTSFGPTATGFTIGNNSTVNVGGVIKIGTLGRIHLSEGATGGFLVVNGGLEMTGGLLSQNNGSGANTIRLNTDVTTFASPTVSRIGNSVDSDTYLELNGNRKFTVADGGAGLDLVLSTVIRNSIAGGAAIGGIVKNGTGTMQIEGGGSPNTYTGPTQINEGTVVLNKTSGVNALGSGAATNTLTIGDGVGGARADKLVIRSSNQIADATNVIVSSSGLLDMDTYNTSEGIGSLTGSGTVHVGVSGTLTTTNTVAATFSGSIYGGGNVAKGGAGNWTLAGSSEYAGTTTVNGGILSVNGTLAATKVIVNSGATLAGSGFVSLDRTSPGVAEAAVTLNAGSFLAPGNSPGILSTGSITTSSVGAAVNYNWELNALTPGIGYDQLKVTGAVDIGSTAIFNMTSSVPVANSTTDFFFLLVNDGTDAITGIFANIAEGQSVTVGGDSSYFYTYTANAEAGQGFGGNDFAIVPEPGATALSILTAAGLLARRRRKVA